MTSERVVSRRACRMGASLLVVAALGCVTMQAPPGFLVLDRDGSQWKAATPQDDRLWVRDFADDDGGDLSFWRDALKDDLLKNRGYTLIAEGEAQDAGGHKGAELVMEATVDGRPYQELLVVFVYEGAFGNTIRVVEFVAEKERFAASVDEVRGSIRTLRR